MTFIRLQPKNCKTRPVEFAGRQLFTSRCTFLIFIISLVVLILIIGCPPVEPGPLEPPRSEPNKVEPNAVETNVVEPNVVEPNVVEPNAGEPKVVEPNEVKIITKVSFHDKCADILNNFVDDEGMVDYRRLKLKRWELQALLDEFAKLDPNEYNSWPKEDKIALWINAFNTQMLNIIVQNYPIESERLDRLFWPPTSIRHISPKGAVGAAKWDKYKFLVMDEEFTLARIEKRFLREKFDEPRVFFAISHASLSSPLLREEPYYGHKLDSQLNDQVRRFLSSPRGFRIDRKKRRVYLWAMLDPNWYGREFVGKYGTDKKFKDQHPATRAVLNFVTKYVSEQDAAFLEREYYDLKYIGYDWRLNDSSGKH
jgi:hypothetical protein